MANQVKQKDATIQVERPNIQVAQFTLVGDTPLIVHRFSEKARKEILYKQQKKAAKKKEIRNPEAEYEEAKCKMANGEDGFPALALKQAIVGSCRFIDGLPMTVVRGVIFVVPDDMETGLLKIHHKKVKMVEDVVRIGNGVSALCYRPYYYGWSLKPKIKYDASVISLEQVVNLLVRAGLSQGLGDWRVERNGQSGSFTVQA